jgi:hypothetical protein
VIVYVYIYIYIYIYLIRMHRTTCVAASCRSTLEVSAVSFQDAAPRVAPVRPLPGEQPAKGFSWDDYEGVHVDDDASGEEEGGWGVVRSRRSQFHSSQDIQSLSV